ncbi:MAG: polysaccharide deacetylase family protein [Ruminococcus sp.]|nr:polysaccharide deacetylase family protein [Ruminococcus sp.]
MKKAVVSILLAAALSGCSVTVAPESRSEQAMNVLEQTQKQDLSHTKIGYGSGTQTDDKNRTTGALDFNRRYGDLNAAAINENEKKITLTFDQGYENGYTAKILDTLKEKKVRAVFFLVKDYAEKNPELVKRMIDEGHIIGNHSVHHYSMPTLDEKKCRSEIMDMHEYIKENFGCEMELFRPPMGEFSQYSLSVTRDCGYKTLMWSFAYADWDTNNQPQPEAALKRVTSAAHEGAIYLLHSVSKTNAEILPKAIDEIRNKGFEFM